MSLRPGDWVEVRTADEIFQTLDASGTLDRLPFMPEMLDACGRQFRVVSRAEQICTDGAPVPVGESRVRGFTNNDVVLLGGVRCSGLAHGGCKRGCAVFWKESWLRKIPAGGGSPQQSISSEWSEKLRVTTPSSSFFCQSSEILQATRSLTLRERLTNCYRAVRSGNYRLTEMLVQTWVWLFWKIHRKLRGDYPRGTQTTTPDESLDLQPGEWVEIKSLPEIVSTLDPMGRNRGLHFTPDMRLRCGERYRVRCRVDNLIAEGTGRMRHLRNTVLLEGAVHLNSYYAFGGCPRCDFQYWREIWLKRVPQEVSASPADVRDTREATGVR